MLLLFLLVRAVVLAGKKSSPALNRDSGLMGEGVNLRFDESSETCEGRRLPIDGTQGSSSTLAFVNTILGRLTDWGVRLVHMVGSESE